MGLWDDVTPDVGTYLYNEDGEDAMQGGFNNPLESEHIVDPVSLEETWGANAILVPEESAREAGRYVDSADQVLRDVTATNPFGLVANSGTDAAREIEENPRKMKAIIAVVAALVVLYLLRPLLTIIAGISR